MSTEEARGLREESDRRTGRGALLGSLAALLVAGGAQAQSPTDVYSYSRTSSFSYYGVGDGAKAGLLRTETVEPNNPQLCVVTTYDYADDAKGNKTSATTANCPGATGRAVFTTRTSSSTYAAGTSQAISVGAGTANVPIPAGLFADSSTNALLHVEKKTYDPRFGTPLSMEGPNKLTTTWKVDDFGRVTRETRADGTSTVSAYCTLVSSGLDTTANSNIANGDPKSCPSVSGEAPSDAVAFVHTEPWDSANQKIGPFVRVYKDRLGRDLRTVTESFDGGDQASSKKGVAVYKDVVYNDYGVKIIETQAYFAGSTSSTTTGSSDVGLSLTVVDVLGRPTAVHVADPAGSGGNKSFGSFGSRQVATTTITYFGLTVTTINDKGQTRKEDKNALGELVRVTDATGATLIHQRDAFGNLHKTKDALGNITTLTYDYRGRKTKLEDPDTGTWNYAYDALGQLVWQQSPKQLAQGAETTMAYDVLGRMTSRGEPEYISTWRYDKNADGSACMAGGANKGIGKLCQSSTSAGVSRQYKYDSLGRPTSSRTSVSNGPSFASSVEYDALGRVIKQTYPTGVQVGYGYTSGLGFLEKLVLNTAATIAPLPNASGQTAAGTTLPVGSMLWQAQVVGAWGKVEQQSYGNGIIGKAAFEAATGRITKLTAGANNSVLAQQYFWDSLSNLQARIDERGDGNTGAVIETFSYGDTLNRLTSYTVSAPAVPSLARTVNLHYNALGMLLYKSDVGNYTYSPQGGAAGSKPHALQSVTGVLNTSFTYDANGNLETASNGKYRSVSYTSFNLPDGGNGLQGPDGLPKYSWQYDENHARIRETRQDASGSRTTWYLHPDNQGGLGFESETAPNGTVSNRHYLSAGGQVIGVLVKTGALPTLTASQTEPVVLNTTVTFVKLEYWHKDHLGSLITTTDHAGNVTARYAYDPFGKRRYTSGTYDPFGALIVDWVNTQNAGTDRGYTGHEHLDDVGIVHMNGRLYDPNLGIMMQADPFIQDPGNLQNYNRYGYCFNNPLTCTDPSGYLSIFGQRILPGLFNNKNLRIVAAVGVAWFLGPGGYAWGQWGVLGTSITNPFAQAAIAGFVSGSIATDSFKGGVQGAFTAMAFFGAGELINGAYTDGFKLTGTEGVMVHAVAGCVTSEVSGAKCGPGALSAAFSKFATVNGLQADGFASVISSAVIGGTASVLGGGKFANGAQTAAFAHLFNYCVHAGDCDEIVSEQFKSVMTGARDAIARVFDYWSSATLLAAGGTAEVGAVAVGSRGGISLTNLMTKGVDTTAPSAGRGLIELTMNGGRSAVNDFQALAANYGAKIETVIDKAGQSFQRFNVGEVTVMIRDFGRTAADWTVQITNKTRDGVKLRYGKGS